MVVLVERLSKIYLKLENHIHHHHHEAAEALQAALETFRSDVSIRLNRLLSNSKPGSEFMSFTWTQLCFELLPAIDDAFAKLVVEIDYPMSKWEDNSVEEYLNYSLRLMELLNSISSSISHLGQARLSLSHALSLVESSPSMAIERLKAFHTRSYSKEFKRPENSKEDGEENRSCSNKEKVVNGALMELKSIGFLVCGVILAGLSGDSKAYMELTKSEGGFEEEFVLKEMTESGDSKAYMELTKSEGGFEEGFVLKEMTELNDSAKCLAAALETGKGGEEAEELQRRLKMFEKVLDNLGQEVNHLFSKLLAGRNELVDGIRRNSRTA